MMLPFIFVFLSATLTESQDVGEACSLTNGNPGVCEFLKNCQSVKQQLIIGNLPDKVCGYLRFDPIVCCPPSGPPILRSNLTGDGRGSISRQKCEEYSQSVWVLKERPVLIAGSSNKINVSDCAIAATNLIFIIGPKARPGEFPHMAAIGHDLANGHIHWHCSGTLISETFVLTAAHCTESRGIATWARLGSLNLERSEDGVKPEDRRIIERINHPDYKFSSEYHNIALLRLETRVPFNRWIRPACLHRGTSIESQRAIASGWGGTKVDGHVESPNNLARIVLSIIDSESCNTNWNSGRVNINLPNGVVDNRLICARPDQNNTCQGDTGGPLTIFSKTYCMWDIVGITSRRNSCDGEVPGLYTRVSNYIPWIESIVWSQD